MRSLSTAAAVRSFDPENPFLRWETPDSFAGPGYASGRALIITRTTQTRGPGMAVVGPPSEVAGLLDELIMTGRLAEFPYNVIAIDEECYPEVDARLELGPGGDWHWMWATTPPENDHGSFKIIELGEPDQADLIAFLAEHNPGTDGDPSRASGQHWIGIREDDGSLVACGGAEPNLAGYPVLSGITVRADRRGAGLGRMITTALTRWAIERHGVCTLGVYASNTVAIRLYESLGYRIGRRWRSRKLLGPRPVS